MNRCCSLCGASGVRLLAGTSSYLCFSCIGAALAGAAATYGTPRGVGDVRHHGVTGNSKCCVCGLPAVHAKLVATYDLWAICGDCLKLSAEICIDDGEEEIGIVPFTPITT